MTQRPISAEYPFESQSTQVAGSRLHYVESGKGDPILFLHGNPTWSYLWRNVIPYAAQKGRAIALDLIGMGKSDKPNIEYRFSDHIRYVEGFIQTMELRHLTLVVHDWGSALGFHYAARHESNVKGIAFMEALLRPVRWTDFPEQVRQMFQAFRTPEVGWDLLANQNVFVEQVLPGGILRKLSDQEMNRYREPFPTPASRKPVWRWPNEIPIDGEPKDVAESVGAYHEWLTRSTVPKLLFHGQPGVILTAPAVGWCRENLQKLDIVDIGPGLHYLQEDNPHRIGEGLAAWYRNL